MPLVDRKFGIDVSPAPTTPADPPQGPVSNLSPTEQFGEGLWQGSSVAQGAQVLLDHFSTPRFEPDPGFAPSLKDLEGYADVAGPLVNSKSRAEFSYWKYRIDSQRRKQEELANSGGWAAVGNLVGMLAASPENLVGAAEGRTAFKLMGATAIGSATRFAAQPEAKAAQIVYDVATAGIAGAIISRTRALAAGSQEVGRLARRYAAETGAIDAIAEGTPRAGIYRTDGSFDATASEEFRAGSHMRAGEEWRLDETGATPQGERPPPRPAPIDAPVSTAGAAQVRPGLTTADLMNEESLVRTGTGLERVGISPNLRLLNQKWSLTARDVVQRLTEIPLFLQKHLQGIASGSSVVGARRQWFGQYLMTRTGTREDWLALRQRLGSSVRGNATLTQLKDLGQTTGTTLKEFNSQVAWAVRNIEKPAAFAGFEPEVQAAAKKVQGFYARFKAEMDHVEFFEAQIRHEATKLETKVEALKDSIAKSASGASSKDKRDMARLLQGRDELKLRLDAVRKGFERPNYVNRVYRREAIRKNENGFRVILERYGVLPEHSKKIVQKILRENPYTPFNDDLNIGFAGAGRARGLDHIPDEALSDFLEHDIDTLMAHYARTAGTDLELTREFGSTHLEDHLDEVARELKANGASEAEAMQVMNDIREVRDLIRGTHALPADPTRLSSRAIRLAKQFNSLVLLTGAQSALPDVGRIIMGNGIERFFGQGLKPLVRTFQKTVSVATEYPQRAVTGQAINLNVRRGTGGGGTMSFAHNAAGSGEYFAFAGSIARHYGKTVEKAVIHLDNPLVLRSDADVEKVLANQGVDLSSLRSGVGAKVATFEQQMRAQFAAAQTPAEKAAYQTNLQAAFATLNQSTEAAREAIFTKLREVAETAGHDGIIVDVGHGMSGVQRGAGSPLHAIQSYKTQDALLARFGHSQVVTFNPATRITPTAASKPAFALTKKELMLMGNAGDHALGMRAMLQADMMDGIENTTAIERFMTRATQVAFSTNLMNIWTDSVKTMAAMVSGTRMLDAIAEHAAGTISAKNVTKLAQLGIDQSMAVRIDKMFAKYGATVDEVKIGNIADWTDQGAADAWSQALNKEVDTLIVTPAPGEKPSFMSSELGSLLFQYRGYGISATQRILMSGLQERDAKALSGVLSMVALGGMVESLRRRQTGDNQPLGLGGWIKAGIDRSGVLGTVMDLNNAMETLSNGWVGVGALLGASKPMTGSGVAGALLGPSGASGWKVGQLFGALATGGDVGRGVRRVLPMQNVFWADGLFDSFEDGVNGVRRAFSGGGQNVRADARAAAKRYDTAPATERTVKPAEPTPSYVTAALAASY